MIKRILFSAILVMATMVSVNARIGYQVALLNNATGEPRENTTVNANIEITNSSDEIVYTGTQQATSNDFGILSLVVGDKTTFQNIDTGKLPLFISVNVNGTLIGKTQILNVPVAEIANKLKSSFTKDELIGTWEGSDEYETQRWQFTDDMTVTRTRYNKEGGTIFDGPTQFTYEIEGNNIWCYTYEKIGSNNPVILMRKVGSKLFMVSYNICLIKQ